MRNVLLPSDGSDHAFQAALDEAGIAHQSHVRFGDTAETIVATAEEFGCDSIVMGTRGLGTLAGLALGSVTRKVLHFATMPVVCVKAAKPAASGAD